jgi:Ca2+/Na+ antiporter
MSVNFLVMTALTVVVSALLAKGRVQRWQGGVLVACYVGAMLLAVRFNG